MLPRLTLSHHMAMGKKRSVAAAVLVGWACLPAVGAAQPIAESASCCMADVPQTTGAIEIDGVLDEAAWREALVLELTTETNPRENLPAAVQTYAYLIEDGSRFLVAFDARDPEPSAIRAYLRDRDSAYNDDRVGVVIDAFNDGQRAFEFFANALGVQMDQTNDDVNKRQNSAWNAIWQSAGRINGEGYVVEMAIPFSQLRFPRDNGRKTWGIDVVRFFPRENRVRLSNNALERGRNCYLCQLETVNGFENAEPGRDLEIAPSMIVTRTDARDDPVVDPLIEGDVGTEAGLNVRWGLTQDITANIAFNPDFSQVEADIPQLDVNNQFALFFPESRPFFLEGADFFSTPINTVFTRNIADPDIGAKLTGRSGDHTFGLFAADDQVTNLLFPAALESETEAFEQTSRAFVGRYSRGFGDTSTIGGLVTSRSGNGYSNEVAGIDGRYRINDQHNLRFQFLTTSTEYPTSIAEEFEQPTGSFNGDAFNLRYNYTSRNWVYNVNHQRFDDGFRADMGFVPRVDIEQTNMHVERQWYGAEGDRWTWMAVGSGSGRTNRQDGQQLNQFVNGFFAIHGPLQSVLRVTTARRKIFWDDVLYDGRRLFFFGEIFPRGGLRLSLFARKGDEVDFANSRLGKERRFVPRLDWNVNEHLLLRLRHTSVRLDSRWGERIFDARLTDARLTWQFNVRSFLRLSVQRRNTTRNLALYDDPDTDARTLSIGSQLLYSYQLNPQTVFFVGYSDNHRDDDELLDRTQTDRTLFMKIGYAWTP